MKHFIIISLLILIFTSCYKEELRDFGDFQEEHSNEIIDNSQHVLSPCEKSEGTNFYNSPHVEIIDFEVENPFGKSIFASDKSTDDTYFVQIDFALESFLNQSKIYTIQENQYKTLKDNEVLISEHIHSLDDIPGLGYVKTLVSTSVEGKVYVNNYGDYITVSFCDLLCKRSIDNAEIYLSGLFYYYK